MQVQHISLWLELPDLRVIQVATACDGTTVVVVEGVATGAKCPKCSAWTNRVHQRRRQWVDDLPHNDRPRGLLLTRRRWRCGCCDFIFAEELPSVARYRRMTVRLEAALFGRLRQRPTKAVANEFRLGEGRLQRLLEQRGDQVVLARPEHQPRFLGVDEFAAKRGQIYNTVFVDLEAHKILEVVETREKKPVREQLSRYQDSVEAVCIDLNEAFRQAVRKALPKAAIVADKFHVIRLASWALNAVRRRVRSQIEGGRRHPIFRSRRVLLRNYEDLAPDRRERLRQLLALSSELRIAYAAKERLRRWYKTRPTTLTVASTSSSAGW
jgi:transposase